MASLVNDLLDRLRQKQADRMPWERHWLEIAVYALPDAERFDSFFVSGNTAGAINAVVNEPIAAKRSKEIFDQTSLWAIDRGANGMLSLVTPPSLTWHDVTTSEPFAADPTDEEQRFYEGYRDYLFATRSNPRSGFATAHKASVRSTWAFGVAVMFVEESSRGVSSPISYHPTPLGECHLGVDFEGNDNENFRLFRRSAIQCVQKWGSKCSAKVQRMAETESDKDKTVLILHAVYPRDEAGSYGNSNRNSPFSSCYVEVDEKHLIGESGYFEFPFRVDRWQRNNAGPYSEGPLALALSDVKSLNMLAKQELRAVQQWTSPPYATRADTHGLNLNANAPNPGFLDDQGNLMVKPIIMQQRPDFANTIIEARRNQTRTTLYIDLWQSIINSTREQTAYEVMIKNQEKGDLLGPVGDSMKTGLSFQFDRETGILARKGAFESGSPLEPPQSIRGRGIGVRFTSPLDRLRRLPELQGMNQLAQSVTSIAAFKPEAMDKIDWDRFIDEEQEILGAPEVVMTPDAVIAQMRQQRAAAANAQAAISATAGAGEAAEAAGRGVETIASSPAASEVLKRLAGVAGVG